LTTLTNKEELINLYNSSYQIISTTTVLNRWCSQRNSESSRLWWAV